MVLPSNGYGGNWLRWHASCFFSAALFRADAAPGAPRSNDRGLIAYRERKPRRHPSGCRRLLQGWESRTPRQAWGAELKKPDPVQALVAELKSQTPRQARDLGAA